MSEVMCFHNPDEENGYLSNWYSSQFVVDGVEFSSMEQYMMYRKAVCFHDAKTAQEILGTDDVARIKALGRLVTDYDDHMWNGVRQIEVYRGLVAKFEQNKELGERLAATGDALLAECAVKDRVWGIGLSMHDPERLDPTAWRGQNLLGYALMEVRGRLGA
ncbi:MAG: NADAR family protein [Bifidobacteriaceae bacterium]|nr:NADAR family protein [Bifidobacteriaceae bacterium]